MKKIICSIFYLLFLFSNSVLAEVGARHVEQSGSFSFQAPKDWQFREFPGMKYQIAFGPVSGSFGSNMNVVDELYAGSLNSYVDLNMKAVSKMFVQFKQIKREPFVTAKGVKAERVIITSMQQKHLLRQAFYFVPGLNDRYYVVTCSTLASNGDKYDEIFNESLRTFEVTKQL